MRKNKEDIEERKLKVEKAKVLEGLVRGLILILIADLGGTLTLIFNFDKYNKELTYNFYNFRIICSIRTCFCNVVSYFSYKRYFGGIKWIAFY